MKLDEIIETRKDELLRVVNIHAKSHENSVRQLNDFKSEMDKNIKIINDIIDNYNNLVKYDANAILSLLEEYSEDLPSKLKYIIVTINAIENGLPVSLTEEDENTIKEIVNKLISKKKTLEEEYNSLLDKNDTYNRLYEDNYLVYEELINILNKIRNPENLEAISTEDFQVLYESIVENDSFSADIKKRLLIEIKKYNMDRNRNEKKEASKIDIRALYDFLDEYIPERVLGKAEKFSSEIVSNIDLDKAKEILEYLNNTYVGVNTTLKSKFSTESLLALIVYGNKYFIEHRFNELKDKALLTDIMFDTPSVWIDNFKKDKKRTKFGSLKEYDSRTNSLVYSAHLISFEEIMDNYNFLKDIGVDINLRKSSRNDKVLKTPNFKLRENFELLKYYGVYDEKKGIVGSALTSSKICQKCDMFIEFELLNGFNECSSLFSNVVKNYPSVISRFDREHFAILASLKKKSNIKDYYKRIFSETRTGMFSIDFTSKKFGYKFRNDDEFNSFINDNFMTIDDGVLPNYSTYESKTEGFDGYTFDENIFLLPQIASLEEDYKISDYAYKFGDQVISRLKVLRIYSSLQKAGVLLDSEALMYSICKNSYIDEDTFNLISECIGYKREEMEM